MRRAFALVAIIAAVVAGSASAGPSKSHDSGFCPDCGGPVWFGYCQTWQAGQVVYNQYGAFQCQYVAYWSPTGFGWIQL